MNKTYEKLRKAVYDIKYPDGIPCERGCEFMFIKDYEVSPYIEFGKGNVIELFHKDSKYNHEFYAKGIRGVMKCRYNIFEVLENLGKELTLQDIMLVIQKSGGAIFEFLGGGNSVLAKLYFDDGVSNSGDIDLTKPIKEQDEEVLEKLLELIK